MGFFSFTDYIINRTKLLNNIKIIKSKLKPNTKFCAVVKADAYGVGAREISSLVRGEVDCFAVANLEEGVDLRAYGISENIIVLGALNFDYLSVYSEKFLSPPVSTVSEMSKLSRSLKSSLQVEFGLNSGMNRIGFSKKSEIHSAISLKNKNKNISIFGVFSHLATKENNVEFMYEQKRNFDCLLTPFKGMKIVRHLSNTNASLNHPDFNYDMVRVGFGMYGMVENGTSCSPVVEIKSRVVLINFVKSGESVGYDRTYIANKKSRIAVVPIGYYDGMSRELSNKGKVLINGKFAPVVGRVCMDMFMVDVTNIPNVEVGSVVTILGCDGGKVLTLTDYAKWCNTSEYEVLTRFNNERMNIIIK